MTDARSFDLFAPAAIRPGSLGCRAEIAAGVAAALHRAAAQGIPREEVASRMGLLLGESSTRMRFRTQTGPDGVAWKKGRKQSGRTLTQDGHLSGSISGRATQSEAVWGVNRVYAAIHQFGGVIKPKNKKALRFKVAGGSFVTAKQVTMPARPFLGISKDDREDILHILRKHYGGGAIAG